MKVHSVGVIGCGHLFVNSILPPVRKSSRFSIRSVFDPALGHGNSLGLNTVPSFESILGDPEIETVWIVSPARFHAEQAVAALRAGKHAYVQKPICTDLQELDHLLNAESESDRCLVAAPGMMAYPTWRLAKREFDSGVLGTPYCAQAGFMGWGGDEVDWPNDPSWFFQTGGGPVRDHGVYTLTALIGILGKPRRTIALGNTRRRERIWKGHGTFEVTERDNFAVSVEFESGVLATLNEAWCAGSERYQFELHGSEGCLRTFGGTWDACPRGYEHIDSGGNRVRRIDAQND